MRILEEIAEKYKKLFNKTGKMEFFIYAKNVERLNNDIMGIDKVVETKEEQNILF